MTERDLGKIELALGISLPKQYRRFARSLPAAYEGDESDIAAFTDVEELISDNLRLRGDEEWPEHFLSIGPHDGNQYFIDLRNPDSGVFYRCHEEAFDPHDITSLRVSSIEELARDFEERTRGSAGRLAAIWHSIRDVFRRPKPHSGFRRGWSVMWTPSEAAPLRRLDNPTSDEIAAEIQRFFNGEFGQLKLHRDPDATGFSAVDFMVLGGDGRCAVTLAIGKDTMEYFDRHAPPGEAVLLERLAEVHESGHGAIAGAFIFGSREHVTCSNHCVCDDLDLIIDAVRQLHEKGRLPSTFPVRVVRA